MIAQLVPEMIPGVQFWSLTNLLLKHTAETTKRKTKRAETELRSCSVLSTLRRSELCPGHQLVKLYPP